MKGLHSRVVSFVRSQDYQKRPIGIVIYVSTGLSGILQEGIAGYATSKLAAHRYLEYVATGKYILLNPSSDC